MYLYILLVRDVITGATRANQPAKASFYSFEDVNNDKQRLAWALIVKQINFEWWNWVNNSPMTPYILIFNSPWLKLSNRNAKFCINICYAKTGSLCDRSTELVPSLSEPLLRRVWAPSYVNLYILVKANQARLCHFKNYYIQSNLCILLTYFYC